MANQSAERAKRQRAAWPWSRMYTIDNPSGNFLARSPRAVGEAAYNQYTILILVNFNRDDLDGESE